MQNYKSDIRTKLGFINDAELLAIEPEIDNRIIPKAYLTKALWEIGTPKKIVRLFSDDMDSDEATGITYALDKEGNIAFINDTTHTKKEYKDFIDDVNTNNNKTNARHGFTTNY